MTTPDPILVVLLDQLATAIDLHDGAGAVTIIGHIRTVAGPDYTNQIVAHLITQGLNRLAGGRP